MTPATVLPTTKTRKKKKKAGKKRKKRKVDATNLWACWAHIERYLATGQYLSKPFFKAFNRMLRDLSRRKVFGRNGALDPRRHLGKKEPQPSSPQGAVLGEDGLVQIGAVPVTRSK